jgi:hypothetical protein
LLYVPLHSNNRYIHAHSCEKKVSVSSHPLYRDKHKYCCVFYGFLGKTGESEDKQITWINDGNWGFYGKDDGGRIEKLGYIFGACAYISFHKNYVRVLQELYYLSGDKEVYSALGGVYLNRHPVATRTKRNPRRVVGYSNGVT